MSFESEMVFKLGVAWQLCLERFVLQSQDKVGTCRELFLAASYPGAAALVDRIPPYTFLSWASRATS